MHTFGNLESRTSQINTLNDTVAADLNSFVELKQLGITASSLEDADHTNFLQDYALVHPLTFRAFSVATENGSNSTSHEHKIPAYGDFIWGMTYAILLKDGIVAFEPNSVTHNTDIQQTLGFTDANNDNATANRSKVPVISTTTGANANFDTNAIAQRVGDWWIRQNGEDTNRSAQFTEVAAYVFAVWDQNNSQYTYTDGTFLTGTTLTLADSQWVYVRDVIFETGDYANTGVENIATVRLEYATKYTNNVAEGFDAEPYFYAPGYTMVKSMVIEEEGSDKLFETNGEVSYFLNQIHRPTERDEEDEQLCHAYTDEKVSKQYRLPGSPHSLLTPREYAQRLARMPQALYTSLRHPFQDPETSIPVNIIFGQSIKFISSFNSPHETLVFPQSSVYNLSKTYRRPKDNNNIERTNEEIRRGTATPSSSYAENDSFNVRLEVFVATVDDEERRELDNANITNVCRQPQTYNDTVSHQQNHDEADGNRLKAHTINQQIQGYTTEFVLYARQLERARAGKKFDLRAWSDDVSQLHQSALYTASFSYDNSQRTLQRADNRATSDLQMRHFFRKLPDFGTDGALHLLSAATHPSENDYTGCFFSSQARSTKFDHLIPNKSFVYKDDEGNEKKTDVHLTIISHQLQVINFTPQGTLRAHSTHTLSML